MIIQGSNNPLTIEFSEDVSALPELVVTVWSDLPKYHGTALKTWTKSMITVNGDTALCPWTERETSSLPAGKVVVEVKGMDGSGNTVFWDSYLVDVVMRRDKGVYLGEE